LESQRKVNTNKINNSSIIDENAFQRIWKLLNGKIMKERYTANKKITMPISSSLINCITSNRKKIIILITKTSKISKMKDLMMKKR
jgi:hypothetical protein